MTVRATNRLPNPAMPRDQQVSMERRLTVSVDEAAAVLGVSRDFFDRHIAHDLRLIRVGRRVLVPTRELDRWVDASAAIH